MLRLLPMLLLIGCAEAKPAVATSPVGQGAMRFESMRFLPPTRETVFAYKTEDLVTGARGVMMLRLLPRGEAAAELVSPSKTEPLQYSAEGIFRVRSGTFLLRTPIVEGTRWPGGPNASMHISRADVRASVEAGSFEHCAEVTDERQGPVQGTIVTTFCPDVGMVLIETRGAGAEQDIHERVELKSYGEPVDIMTKPR